MPDSFLFNKVAGPRPAILLKKRLLHRCFPVSFAKFLRTIFHRTPLDDCFHTQNIIIFYGLNAGIYGP